MFLANSLKEKLKRNFLENESDNIDQTKHPYKAPPRDPRILLSFRQGTGEGSENQENLIPQNFFSTQKLQSLDRKEWENTFNLDKLHSEWKTRVNLDFENNFKKFSDDFILPNVIQAKKDAKNLVDPDLLELKKKQWNISFNLKDDVKPELEKKIFEIANGLKDFKIVPIKKKEIIEGVDSRDHLEVDGGVWNISNQVNLKDFQKDDNKKLYFAKENSIKYWKTNNEFRKNEQPFPIPEEKKKIEIIRYFKKYRTPYQKNVDYYKTMEKIKEDTFIERENAEKKVKYKYPGSEKYPEKINALVLKEMYNTYKYKYNERTGRLSKEELKKKQREKNRFKWSDADLANKILAVNKMTGINENLMKGEGIKTYNSRGFLNNINYRNKPSFSQESGRTISYLFPLVSKGTEIHLEEEKIQERLNEEYKRMRKRELLLNVKSNRSFNKDTFESKYPLSKEHYETIKKLEKDNAKKYKSNQDTEKNINQNTNPKNNIESFKSKTLPIQSQSSYLSMISKSSNCGPFFLEAYNKVAEKEIKRLINLEKKNNFEKTFEYSHPGTYREFTFFENNYSSEKNTSNTNNNNGPSLPSVKNVQQKKVKVFLWSCCMNNDKNSRECKKKSLRNYRWIYNP